MDATAVRAFIRRTAAADAPSSAVAFALAMVVWWDYYGFDPVDIWRIRSVSPALCLLATVLLQESEADMGFVFPTDPNEQG